MKRIVFYTLGTGIGTNKNEKIQSLAHGILSSIMHYDPDFLVFFGSEKSKITLDSLKIQFLEEKGHELENNNHQFILINDIDNFDECFEKIRRKVEEFDTCLSTNDSNSKKPEIIIDYTSGTKTMTMSAAIVSMLFHKKLSLISGTRSERGVVIKGTERIQEQNIFRAYDKMLLDRIIYLFNIHRFDQAYLELDNIITLEGNSPISKKSIELLLRAYSKWDKFEHIQAWNLMKKIDNDFISKIDNNRQINSNKEFLAKLSACLNNGQIIVQNVDNIQNIDLSKAKFFLIADLINNICRRIEEKKFDDATARLYRVFELIAQFQLYNKYQLDTSDICEETLKAHLEQLSQNFEEKKCSDISENLERRGHSEMLLDLGKSKTIQTNEIIEKNERIKRNEIPNIILKLQSLKDENGVIKIGLFKDYDVLYALNDPIGKEFIGNEKLHHLLSKRNYSILAHGLSPMKEDDVNALFECLEKFQEFIRYTPPDGKKPISIKRIITISQFPKISF